MKLFFDNCTSPVFADTLGGFVRHLGHSAHHISTLPCGRGADDLVWIKMLAETGKDWLVITGDIRISRNKAERSAYRQAGLIGFALAPAYQKAPVNHVASLLVWRWPEMENLVQLVAAPALYELPISRQARLRSLSL